MSKVTVEIRPPMSYAPASVQINAGDTVEWVSRDNDDVHTVTANDGTMFSSPALNGGDTFQFTFTSAGSFPYHCAVHGLGMAGTVNVVAASVTHTVEILPPMSYAPASLRINVGETVEWVSRDDNDVHTVTANDGTTFSSALLNGGDKFQFTFASAGSFPYHCEVHGKAMSGVVEVVASA